MTDNLPHPHDALCRDALEKDIMQVVKTIKQESELLGEKRGMQQEKLKIARQMLSKGLEMQLICEMTGLSREKIEQLQRCSKIPPLP